MITHNSRYVNSTVATVMKDGQDTAVIVPSPAIAYSFNYVSHLVVQGDRADSLAYQYYTDATQWWRIADANPGILHWASLTPGIIIRIPVS